MSETEDSETGLTVIAAEAVGEVRAWTFPDLSPKQPAKAKAEPEAPRLPTAREIEEIEASAWTEGHTRGLAEGRHTGYETGLAEARDEAARLGSMLDHLHQPLAGIEEALESHLMHIAVELAERLLHRQLELEPAYVQTVVRNALDALGRTSAEIRMHVNPDDAALIELVQGQPGQRGWSIVPDPSVSRGGCRAETDHGQVDATIETRIAELRRELFGAKA